MIYSMQCDLLVALMVIRAVFECKKNDGAIIFGSASNYMKSLQNYEDFEEFFFLKNSFYF